ncbi:MAG: DoxX family protein [Luteolibacter sp.]
MSDESKSQRPAEVIALIARVVLGCWFAYSGGLKIFGTGLDRFLYDVDNYKMLAAPWDVAVAYSLPWVELVAGFFLMLGIFRRGALLSIFGLVATFAIAIGWAWKHGLDIACGCHGGDAKIRYWAKAAEFSGYFLLLAWLWWMESRHALRRTPPATN